MPDVARQLTLYQLLVERSLGLMCIHDLEGVILSVNPAVERSLGYPSKAGIGRNLKEFLAPAVRPLFDDYLRRICENGADSGLMRLVASDGTERVWAYRNIRYDEPGRPSTVLGHALDVTVQARAEQELRESRKALARAHDDLAARVIERTAELRETNERLVAEMAQRQAVEEELLRARKLESLGVLAGGIAHDFNNFLTVIQGNIELAAIQLRPGDAAFESLEQAAAACKRAAVLATQLLTFAKGGAPVRRSGSIAALLKDAVDLSAAGSNTTIRLSMAPDLHHAEFDAAQMTQVLHNVLLNARQSLGEGGKIEVEAANVDDPPPPLHAPCVRIVVRDHGCGIPPDVLPRIFDPYFTTKETGSGLGLATAYAIVNKHQGRIAVESKVGEGTTVSIYLPASAQPVEAAPEVKAATPRRGSGRILVMDDDPHIRRLLADSLKRLGYEVACAPGGAEAVTAYTEARERGAPFAAAILDLTIAGGMGGRQTAAKLKELDPGAKLILSSGYSADEALADHRKHGFDEVLLKPWSPEQLGEAIHRVLG